MEFGGQLHKFLWVFSVSHAAAALFIYLFGGVFWLFGCFQTVKNQCTGASTLYHDAGFDIQLLGDFSILYFYTLDVELLQWF